MRDARSDELEDWDARTVDAPGGHVYQSRAWAEHRRVGGWRPRFLVADDGGRALALTRPWPVIGGGSAYVPRGPVPIGADPTALGGRLVAIGEALAGEGIDVVAADAEVPAAEAAFRATIEAAGFRPIEEIQPSRHRISLPLVAGADEAAVFEAIAKSTRQRIRGAERAEVAVVRHDAVTGAAGPGDGFLAPSETATAAFDRFYDLLLETGERRHFSFGPRAGFVALVERGPRGRSPRVSRGEGRGCRRFAAGRADPLPPRGPALDRPLGGPRRDQDHAPGGAPPAPLAGHPAGDSRGERRDGPGRRRCGRFPGRTGRG